MDKRNMIMAFIEKIPVVKNKIHTVLNSEEIVYNKILNDIEHILYTNMKTLQLVPIKAVKEYFNIESFDMITPTDTIRYDYGELILFGEPFIGYQNIYYFSMEDSKLCRVDVFYDDVDKKYEDFVEVSYFGSCPDWLKNYKNNILNRYK